MSTPASQPPPPAAPERPEDHPDDRPEEEVELTFTEHLEELRTRIIYGILGVALGVAVAFIFAEDLFHLLMVPVLDALPKGQQALIYTSALEKFFVYLRVAVYAGVFLSAPNVLYQLWRFVAPGLYRRERRLVLPFVVSGSIMFVAGAVFCYLVILPNAFEFLIAFGGAADWTRPMLSLKEQLSLVLMLELAFGVVFEIPLIIAFLSMIGVVQASWLARYRRHAAVVITFIAAVITPTGDPFNLALMAVPMYLFYEIGILLARVLGKRREELAEEEAAEASKS